MSLGSCVINSGYTIPCRTNVGGIKNIYVGVWNDTSLTYTVVNNEITAFTGGTSPFFTITQRIEQGQMFFQIGGTVENGTSFIDQTVEIVIEQVDNQISQWISLLRFGHWRILVLDNNGQYWMLGLKNGLYVTTGNGGSHKQFADGNKMTITFTGKEPYEPMLVSPDTATTIIV